MSSQAQPALEIRVGERFIYNTSPYDIVEIRGDRIQLRSAHHTQNIFFQSWESLQLAYQKGNFQKIREAPLLGATNKIIENLSTNEKSKLNRKLAYTNAANAAFGLALPRKKTIQLIAEVSRQINDPHPPSYGSLYSWHAKLKKHADNPLCLICNRAKHFTPRVYHQPVEAQDIIEFLIKTMYLIEVPYTKTQVIDAITRGIEASNELRPLHDQLSIPSVTTLYRIISEVDTYEVDLHQKGYRTAIRNQGWSRQMPRQMFLLACVECDSHVIDLMLVDDDGEVIGKAYLTIALAVQPRYVIGWDISLNPPCVETTIRAIKMSLSDDREYCGQACKYVADNGSEFIAEKLKYCLELLGSEITFCEPLVPNQKPHVERFFETLNVSIMHHLKGTTFSNPGMRGDYDSEANAVYTLDVLRERFEDWLTTCYHNGFHSSLNTSPQLFWQEQIKKELPLRKHSQQDINSYFMSKASVTVQNGRVRHNNLQWTCAAAPYLSTLGGKKSKLTLFYDCTNLGTAWICHPLYPNDLHIAEAVDPYYQNDLTLYLHTLVQIEIRKAKKSFNFREARNNKLRILLASNEEQSKRQRNRQARLRDERKTKTSKSPLSAGLKTTKANTACIDPDRHLDLGLAPSVGQVMEVPRAR